MNFRNSVLLPKFVWLNGTFRSGIQIRVNSEGIIEEVSENVERRETDNIVDLHDQALVPGFINTHSHAFHRHLRGRSEIGKVKDNNFWAWRDNMYELARNATPETVYKQCLSTFKEMLSAGITTVGEFHYLHHGKERFDNDQSVLKAASEAGIRIVLIQTLYQRAGFDSPPLHPVQKRFTCEYEEFMVKIKELMSIVGGRSSLAVAAHSARAVDMDTIARLYEFAVEKGLPFHMHLEEQPKEIEQFREHEKTHDTVSDAILERLKPDSHFTGVHNTFTPSNNMKRFADSGANVSICPCTEGYLGDGFPHILENLPISFGTDCNNRLCFLEEMRWACFTQQMVKNSRNVCSLSPEKLLDYATVGGARSLGLTGKVGTFEIGKALDFVSFDLNSPLLEDQTGEQLADAIVFSCGNREIAMTAVDGYVVYQK